MTKRLALLLPLFACASAPKEPVMPRRPVHTFSIVARDPATGEVGVAVQSHWFNVGAVVSWTRAGVGAVATQSFVNVSFGPRGLALLEAGRAPADALAELLADDPGKEVRQVALVDTSGRVAVHTGSRCIRSAGHRLGEGYGVQANMMLNDDVVPAMAKAFEGTRGPLAHRLIAALEAAQAAGGDIRGRQSAAIQVVRGEATGDPARDVVIDLRVEDHATPVKELRRLYDVHSAYEHMNAGDAAMEADDMPRALAEYARAATLVPGNVEIQFWNAFTLATNGHLDEALPMFQRVFGEDANWIELLRRLPAAGLTDDATVERILERTKAR